LPEQLSSLRLKPDEDARFLAAFESDSVFPATLVGRGRAIVSIENLKRREMHVDRMKPAKHEKRAAVDEMPNLDVAAPRRCDSVVGVEVLAADRPHQRRRLERAGA
jgi:hypothetical protein